MNTHNSRIAIVKGGKASFKWHGLGMVKECAMKEKNRKEKNGREGKGGKERDLKDVRRRRKNSRT